MTDKNTALRNAALYAAEAKMETQIPELRDLHVSQALRELRRADDNLTIEDVNESGIVQFLLALLGLE